MKVDRLFLDTNVLISGLLFPGNEALLLELADRGLVKLVISQEVIGEAGNAFQEKWPARLHVLQTFLSDVEYELAPMPTRADVEASAQLVRDPKDAPILAGIILAKPDFAITGDKDLLTDEVRAIAPVCMCAEYLEKLFAEG